MTMLDAHNAHTVPAHKANNNCVQDAQWRLRDALTLAGRMHALTDAAPSYVVKAVSDLRSWL
jgi:hypothetical protein